jgi:hypothetical protein
MSQIQNYLAASLDVQSDYLLNTISKEEAIQKISELKSSIKTEENSDTVQAFFQEVAEEITKEALPVQRRASVRKQETSELLLPMRYIPETLDGHVEPLPFHHNGLVHGAMIRKKEYNIFCYAHRWFYHKSQRWAKNMRASESVYKEEVAGLFEKYNKDGISLGLPIRNVTLFDPIFVNASSPSYLEKNCVSSLKHFGPRKRRHLIMENSWFYLPHDDENADYFKNSTEHWLTNDLIYNKFPYTGEGEPTKIIHQDTGIPSPFLQGENFDRTFKKENVELIGDRLLSQVDAKVETPATTGFVVNSPYLKVFSLSPDNSETIVSILNAWRDCSHKFYKGSGKKEIKSGSHWKTFLIQ